MNTTMMKTGVILAASVGISAVRGEAKPVTKMNVIYILADDLGYGDLG